MENKVETTVVHWGNFRIMENKMETPIVNWCNMGIIENKMEATSFFRYPYITPT